MEELNNTTTILSMCAFFMAYFLTLFKIMNTVKHIHKKGPQILTGVAIGIIVFMMLGMNVIIAVTASAMIGMVYAQYLVDFGE